VFVDATVGAVLEPRFRLAVIRGSRTAPTGRDVVIYGLYV